MVMPATGEADALRCRNQRLGEVVVVDFGDLTAVAADQELGLMVMRMTRLLDATDGCGKSFNAVHQTLFLQGFQGAINGRRRRCARRARNWSNSL